MNLVVDLLLLFKYGLLLGRDESLLHYSIPHAVVIQSRAIQAIHVWAEHGTATPVRTQQHLD
jgi:hypothetical protein